MWNIYFQGLMSERTFFLKGNLVSRHDYDGMTDDLYKNPRQADHNLYPNFRFLESFLFQLALLCRKEPNKIIYV
jgi:hypothetical protein